MPTILIYFFAILLICLVCIRSWYRIFSWLLRIFLTLVAVLVLLWLLFGRALFLWPTDFGNAPGKRLRIKDALTVMDSSNVEECKFVILLQGKCSPMPGARKTSRNKWAKRARQMMNSGYRVFLVEHRWHLFQSNLKQRIQDLDDVYHYLINKYPRNMISIVGGSFGVTVAFKWAAQQHCNQIYLPHLVAIVGLSPVLSFSNAFARVSLPYFMIPDAMPPRAEMVPSSDPLEALDDDYDHVEISPKFKDNSLEENDPFSNEDYLLFPMNIIAGHIPFMLVYSSDDPCADYQIWEKWYDEHRHHPDIGFIPAIQLIKLKNSKKYRGIQSHTDSPLTDRKEWLPKLANMFVNRWDYYSHHMKGRNQFYVPRPSIV